MATMKPAVVASDGKIGSMSRGRPKSARAEPLAETTCDPICLATRLRPSEKRAAKPRARLMAHLDQVRASRLTVVGAPAGYGKTSLLSDWYDLLARDHATAWLSLHGAQRTAVFEAYLAAMVATISPAGLNTYSTAAQLIAGINTGLRDVPQEVYLFFDDVHALSDSERSLLSDIIEDAPENVRFIFGTRSTSGIRLGRARARRQLLILDETELALNSEELAEARHSVGSHCSDDEWQDIVAAAEGWPAGLALAKVEDYRSFFAEDVFPGLAPDERRFLVETSILQRLDAEICDFLTGRSDSRELMARLQANGCFLQALGEDRYRAHPLMRAAAGLELPKKQAEEFHRGAAGWYRGSGKIVDALHHAAAANDKALVLDILENHSERLVHAGEIELIEKHCKTMSWEDLAGCPSLALSLCWIRIKERRLAEASDLLDAAKRAIVSKEQQGLLTVAMSQRLHWRALQRDMVLTSVTGDAKIIDEQCEQLLRESDPESPSLIISAQLHMIEARRNLFQFEDTDRFLLNARAQLSRSKLGILSLYIDVCGGLSYYRTGRTLPARDLFERAMSLRRKLSERGEDFVAMAALPMARLAYDLGDMATMERLVGEFPVESWQYCGTEQLLCGYAARSRVAARSLGSDAALYEINQGIEFALGHDLAQLRLGLAREKVELLIRMGEVEEAIDEAARVGVLARDPPPTPGANSRVTDETRAMIWARLALCNPSLGELVACARGWSAFCQRRGAVQNQIPWLLVLAQGYRLDSNETVATRALRDAVRIAGSASLIGPFLDDRHLVDGLVQIAFKDVLQNSSPFVQSLAATFALDQPRKAEEDELSGSLTPREREILALVGTGLSNGEVGRTLGLTEGTVKWYMCQIYDKLGTRRRVEAVARGRSYGFIA